MHSLAFGLFSGCNSSSPSPASIAGARGWDSDMLTNRELQGRHLLRAWEAGAEPRLSLLLIEDDSAYASHICATLESAGAFSFTITHISMADHALSLLAGGHYQIALFDAGAPSVDSLYTVAEFSAVAPEVALVVLADGVDEKLARRVAGLGADEYIARPHLNAKLLPLTLSQVARRKQLANTAERMVMDESTNSQIGAIIESSPVGLAYFDRELQIRLVNHSYAQIWQGTPAASLGRSLYSVAPCLASHAEAHQRALTGETVSFRDCEIVDPVTGNWRYYDIHYITARNKYGKSTGLVSAAVDLTERYELDKLKDELLMYAAHELRTPLTSLKGFAKLALRAAEATGDKEMVEYLGAISQQINQANRLASSLLDLSRIEHGIVTLEAGRFDIVEFARSIARRYELSWPDFRFSLTFPASPTWVRADRQLIEQVLTQLIENGLKYSAGDRRIDIVMEVGEGEIVTSVRDYGIGIPASQRDRVFDRFSARPTPLGRRRAAWVSGFLSLVISSAATEVRFGWRKPPRRAAISASLCRSSRKW